MPLISDFIAASHPAAHGRRAAASTALPTERTARACLTVRVPCLDTQAVRRALHRALGDRIDIYTLSVDTRHAVTTLQLQACRGELAALMDAIMAGIPEAEFGAIVDAWVDTQVGTHVDTPARAQDGRDTTVLH